MAYTLCQYYPNMKITVCDLQSVVDSAHHFRPSSEDCPNQGNVSYAVGDFFQPDLPKADLFILCRVLHDWPEEKLSLILSNVFKCLSPGISLLFREIWFQILPLEGFLAHPSGNSCWASYVPLPPWDGYGIVHSEYFKALLLESNLGSKHSCTAWTKFGQHKGVSRIQAAWKMGREQKDGRSGVGEGKEGNACPQTPWFWKTPTGFYV